MKSYNLINGNIITLNAKFPTANSLSIQHGKIIRINNPKKNTINIDLKGKTVIPGFIDAHFHLKNFGKRLEQLNLKGINDLNKIGNYIEKKLKSILKDEWLLGFGWDQNLWKGSEYPSSDFLNKLSPDIPVYLTRIDGHSAWVNEAAMNKARVSLNDLKSIKGGSLINDCIVVDNSMNFFTKILPSDSVEQIKKWIKKAIDQTIKMGITGVHDAWQDYNTVQAIKELIIEGAFPIRCYGMLAGNDKKLLNMFFKNGHYDTEYYKIRSVKAFIDGALGSRGAALHSPYCDDKNNCGLILISKEEFDALSMNCYNNNYQLNTHAIGDRGNSHVLDTYSKVLKTSNNRRWRIEHAQMVQDTDLMRFKDYSILPSMQPSHCTSDMPWLHERLGDERLKLISRWKSFIQLDLKIPGGSDCPIESGNPLFEFYAAVTRKNHQGLPNNGWQPQEKVMPIQALKMFTQWAAYGGFDELRRGTIEIGYDADLTILSKNLLDINDKEILSTSICYTIVNGKIIYENLN